jgi:hypothetical protein
MCRKPALSSGSFNSTPRLFTFATLTCRTLARSRGRPSFRMAAASAGSRHGDRDASTPAPASKLSRRIVGLGSPFAIARVRFGGVARQCVDAQSAGRYARRRARRSERRTRGKLSSRHVDQELRGDVDAVVLGLAAPAPPVPGRRARALRRCVDRVALQAARAWTFQTAGMSSIDMLLTTIAAAASHSASGVPSATASGPAIAAPSGLSTNEPNAS